MNKSVVKTAVISMTLLVISCASPAKYLYEGDAITLHIRSVPDLNLYEGQAQALLLCIYQLSGQDAFNQLSDKEENLSGLKGCHRFGPSVIESKRFIIRPNEDKTETLDRAEGTKFLGIAAGYFGNDKDSSVRLAPVPVGIFTKDPAEMDIDLYLGSQGIHEFSVE
ncbi:MAG: type VI secretion system lipoprotein TssJ [Nitrospirae bacterium]|nr:type VI secretion system lipoprotein TssJ [Nitrospirota bacterium]